MILHTLTAEDFEPLTAIITEFIDILAPGVEAVDARPFFAGAGNVGFRTEDRNGYVLFPYLGQPGMYDGHLICRPKITKPIEIGRAGVALMFTHWRASVISALIPKANRASRVAFRAIGGKPIGDSVDVLGRPCTAYVLEQGEWVKSLGPSRALRVPLWGSRREVRPPSSH